MAAVKPQRHGPAMDMTAMCDVAFLLLTFFIMTTQFKSQESVTINTPSSVSPDKLPETNIGQVSIDKDGKFYFGVVNPLERKQFAQTLSDKFNLGLSGTDINTFSKIAEVGIPMAELKGYLNLSETQRAKVIVKGIPCDSAKAELVDWVKVYVRDVNPSAKLSVRGDGNTQYPAVKSLFDEFGKAELNKFQLVTKSETK